jgi:integral membrane protein (TIGR01906 family)
VPPITELTRIEPIHLQRLSHQGVFTTGLLLEVSETATRRQTLADQVQASPNEVLAWRDEAWMLNLAGFGTAEHEIFRFAGIDGLGALLAVDLATFRAAVGRAAKQLQLEPPGDLMVRRGGSRRDNSRTVSAGGSAGRSGLGRRLAGVGVALATALVITGVAIALFFNPAWVSFAQGRANAAAYTGWTAEQVDAVTRDIVLESGSDRGPSATGRRPAVFDGERSHMVDVRGVLMMFYTVVAAALAALFIAGLASRRARWFRGAVALGAGGLAVGAVVVGIAFFVFFDTAFTLFHQLFFAAGTWSFDPATDRMVQLLPYQFWTETSAAISVVGLGLTLGVWAAARRRARPDAAPAGQDPAPTPAEC